MNKIFQVTVFFLLIGFSTLCVAQGPNKVSSTNKKAIKLYEKGRAYYDGRNN